MAVKPKTGSGPCWRACTVETSRWDAGRVERLLTVSVTLVVRGGAWPGDAMKMLQKVVKFNVF